MEPLKPEDVNKVNISNIVTRLAGPTPEFWKKIRNGAISVVIAATAVVTIATTGPLWMAALIPVATVAAAKYIIVAGTIAGLQAQTTTTVKP